MHEVFGILAALAALLGGLWLIGWAAGDFQRRQGSSSRGGAPSKPASS